MIKNIENLLRKITGFQTPLFGLSIDPSAGRKGSIPKLLDPICITYSDNEKSISFLQENNDRIVFIKSNTVITITTSVKFITRSS